MEYGALVSQSIQIEVIFHYSTLMVLFYLMVYSNLLLEPNQCTYNQGLKAGVVSKFTPDKW